MNQNYHYSSIDLLENPQKYQMSAYEGPHFLISYKKSRNYFLEILEEKNTIDYSINEICDHLVPDIKFDYSIERLGMDIDTKSLLAHILSSLIKHEKDSDVTRILDIFVRKFEIKKRIFASYNSELKKPTSDNYSVLGNYIFLSTVCLLRYARTSNLKYLNASLKLNDMLCSQITKIKDRLDIFLFRYVLQTEQNYISKLCKVMGVVIND